MGTSFFSMRPILGSMALLWLCLSVCVLTLLLCLFVCLSVCLCSLFCCATKDCRMCPCLLPTVPPSWPFGGAGVALFFFVLAEAPSGRPDLGHEVCSCCGACQTMCLFGTRHGGAATSKAACDRGQGTQYGRPPERLRPLGGITQVFFVCLIYAFYSFISNIMIFIEINDFLNKIVPFLNPSSFSK